MNWPGLLHLASSIARDLGFVALLCLLVVLIVRDEVRSLSPFAKFSAQVASRLIAAAFIGHIAAIVLGSL